MRATTAGPPRAVQHAEELLAMKDVDGVLISTPEHSHSPLLKMAVEAGKDVYVEKPMGNVLSETKAARDAVVQSKSIVQVGTQHRSEPLSAGRSRNRAKRSARRCEQGRSCVELSRPTVARTSGSKADSRARHRLEAMAANQTRPSLRSPNVF